MCTQSSCRSRFRKSQRANYALPVTIDPGKKQSRKQGSNGSLSKSLFGLSPTRGSSLSCNLPFTLALQFAKKKTEFETTREFRRGFLTLISPRVSRMNVLRSRAAILFLRLVLPTRKLRLSQLPPKKRERKRYNGGRKLLSAQKTPEYHPFLEHPEMLRFQWHSVH